MCKRKTAETLTRKFERGRDKAVKRKANAICPILKGERAEILSQFRGKKCDCADCNMTSKSNPRLRWGALIKADRGKTRRRQDSCRALVKCQIDLELNSWGRRRRGWTSGQLPDVIPPFPEGRRKENRKQVRRRRRCPWEETVIIINVIAV